MSALGINPFCFECEQYDNWIEIVIRDEHNQPFPNIKGVLIDASGAAYPVTAGEFPILLTTLAPGRVTIKFDNTTWINETQKRLPADEVEAGINQWLCAVPKGHQDCSWSHQKLTLGDFVDLEKDQTIPTRHRANALERPNLFTNQSHYITIQGCRYITLRLGMFFDGTGNNSYSAKWGKLQLDAHFKKWKCFYDASEQILKDRGRHLDKVPAVDMLEGCFKLPETMINAECSSAENELTNIQKLFDLYLSDEFNHDKTVYQHAQYITGIGTGNSTDIAPADEKQSGKGTGTGDYGVIEKVNTGIEQVCNQLEDIIRNINRRMVIDGFRKLEFDVFGFSRGAAAARHFINVVLDGNSGLFAQQFVQICQSLELHLSSEFAWDNNANCQIMFAGLFDTVAAIANIWDGDLSVHDDDNDPVRLWLNPERVRKAVHLVANNTTEYRHNFSVNLLNPAPNFDEIVVPGAHSDIGGGYHSRTAFNEQNYLLPLLENQLIESITENYTLGFSERNRIQSLVKQLETTRDFELKHGWGKDSYHITKPEITYKTRNQKSATMRLYYRRCTEGDLSRLYLRVMYGLAEFAGVPVDENKPGELSWNAKKQPYSLYYPVQTAFVKPNSNEHFPFNTFCEQALQAAKKGQVEKLQQKLGVKELRDLFIELGLIHHSANESTSYGMIKPFKPHVIKGLYEREEHECEKES